MNDRARRIANLSLEQRRLLEHMLQDPTQVRTDEGIPALSRYSESGQPAAFPLSSAQRVMWLNEQPPSRVHNIPLPAMRLRGPLDVGALEASLQEICTRHEALRTTFGAQEDGEPVQIVGPPRPVALTQVDLRELPPEAREAEVSRLLAQEARRPFDLSGDLMLRATLARLDEEHVLLLAIHHIVSDGWSVDVLIGELSALYNALRSGRRASLPELPVQYVDYVAWQQQRLEDGELQRLMDYWKNQLADAPVALHLPSGSPRLWLMRTSKGTQQELRMPAWLLQELQLLCRRQSVTLFMTLLAAWATLLHRYSGEEDILIGTFAANRNRPEVENLIGYFATLLILRHDLSADPPFTEFLKRVRKTAVDAFSHSELPVEKFLKELYIDCQVTFTLQTAARSSLKLDGLQVEPVKTDASGSTPFLKLVMIVGDKGLTARLAYNAYLFEATTIIQMLEDFQGLLKGIVADPEQRISRLPLLSEAERGAAAAEAQPLGPPVRPTQARSLSMRLRKRLRQSLRQARRAAGRLLRTGQAWPLVGRLFVRTEKVLGRLLPPM